MLLLNEPTRMTSGNQMVRAGIGRVPAGFPSPAQDYATTGLSFDDLLVNDPAATFVLEVTGDSMIDAGISDGDRVVVDRSIPPADGHVVVAVIDGQLTLKRLRWQAGAMHLVPDNPAHHEIRIDEFSDVTIWGVATTCLHKL